MASEREGHTIAHRVKDALMSSNHTIMDVLVHIEPAKVTIDPTSAATI